MTACLVRVLATILLALALPRAAGAQPRPEAVERFSRGVRLFNEGDNAGAAAEFRRAFERGGEVAALFNLGLVYVELSRPVDAVDTLDQVLKSPGALSPERRERARRVRDEQAARIALLLVTTVSPARVDIDNIEMARTPFLAPLRVAAGTRLVTVVAPGHAPASKLVTLPAGARTQVELDLVAFVGTLAQVRIKSNLPGADVLVDGSVVGHTPLAASLPVTPGRHEITLRRPGFSQARQTITVEGGATADVELEAEEVSDLGATGVVRLAISEPDATVLINGRPRPEYRRGLRLPEGVHRLSVQRTGFFPVERDIVAASAREGTVRVTLDPTEETRVAHEERASGQRWRALLTVALGAVVAGGGGFIYLRNEKELKNARVEYDEVDAMTKPGGQCYMGREIDHPACQAKINHAQQRLDRATTMRAVGLGVAGVGAAALLTGGVLWLLAEDPDRYEIKDEGGLELARRARPFLALRAAGAVLGVSLAF